MIMLLDTSSPVCRLTLVEDEWQYEATWEANRELAKGLLGFIESELQRKQRTLADIAAVGVYKGPGSFTGLRIGLTVCNTLADALSLPIVGETGDGWQGNAVARLKAGENERFVMPLYGGEAHITTPRK